MRDNNGCNGLMRACASNHSDVVSYLLNNVYNDLENDEKEQLLYNKQNGNTAILECAIVGNVKSIELLFEFCQEACEKHCNVRNKSGRTPFWYACKHNRLKCAEKVITRENVNMADNGDQAPLYVAVEGGHDKMTNLLCGQDKYDADVTNIHLKLAVEKGNTIILCQLLLARIRRMNINDISQLQDKKNGILNDTVADEWLNICHKKGNLGLYSFLTKLKKNGLDKKNGFDYIKALLTMSSDDDKNKDGVDILYTRMRKGNKILC